MEICVISFCTRPNIMLIILSVTCDRSVVFSGYTGYYTNKTDRHDITETLLKVALNTINQTPTLNTDQKLSKADDRLNASVKHNFMDTSIKSRFLYFNSFSKWKMWFCLVLIDNDILFSLMALVLYSIIKLWLSILPAVGRYRCWWTDSLFGSLLPPVVCRSAHVLFTLFVFVCV